MLVHGASGGVGTAAIQIARALGLTVIGTASTETGRDLVLNLGAAHALDHTAPGYLDKTYALTHGRGVDLIIEMAAHKNLQRDTGILARNGRVVIVGSRGPVEISPRSLMVAEADIRGTALWNMTPDDFHDAYAAIDRLVAEGLIHPVIGKQFPLEEAAEAHRFITNSHALGKVILHPYG
ncbi:hypothetical protein AR539_09145 [Arthrobacter sp. EPSL27]|nr:hypothetical protein AR539_09145 [Arthrobacter sp. EPSL27]